MEQEGWGDIAGLRSALNAVWDFVVSGNLTEGDWVALLARCKTATPDSKNFSPLTRSASAVITAAQEAGFMVTLLLEFCTDPDPNYGTRIASFARDTVDQHVQALKELNPTDPRFEEKIAEHPLMIQELREQQEDLVILRETTALDGLKQFRQRASNPKQSNIGLIPRAST